MDASSISSSVRAVNRGKRCDPWPSFSGWMVPSASSSSRRSRRSISRATVSASSPVLLRRRRTALPAIATASTLPPKAFQAATSTRMEAVFPVPAPPCRRPTRCARSAQTANLCSAVRVKPTLPSVFLTARSIRRSSATCQAGVAERRRFSSCSNSLSSQAAPGARSWSPASSTFPRSKPAAKALSACTCLPFRRRRKAVGVTAVSPSRRMSRMALSTAPASLSG